MVSGLERADVQTGSLGAGPSQGSGWKTDERDPSWGRWEYKRLAVADTMVEGSGGLAADTGLDTGPAEVDRTKLGMGNS